MVDEAPPSVRSLTYAAGRTIYFGDQKIDVSDHIDREVDRVDATDDGAVFLSSKREADVPSSENPVWFTDGSEVLQIGATYGSPSRGYDLEASDAGSVFAWWEPLAEREDIDPDPGEIVVYDTGQRRVLARIPAPHRLADHGGQAAIEAVYDDSVYWKTSQTPCVDVDKTDGRCLHFESLMRYDVATGRQEEVSGASYDEERFSRPRTLVRGDSPDSDKIENHPDFWRVGSRLVALDDRPPALRVRDFSHLKTTAFDARTGEPVRLRVPAGYSSTADTFHLVQWLDDDRVTLIATGAGSEADDKGDILLCTVSTGGCELAVKDSGSTADTR